MSANNFVWYELMTDDVAAATDFYKKVVGWNAEAFGGSGIDYMVMSAGKGGVGGIMTIPEEARAHGARPGWMGYIGVPDTDEAAAKVAAAGGAIHKAPADIPNVGRFAVVADPQGAAFMLMTPQGENPPPPPADTPGRVGWNELMAGELESAFAFYSGQFGWTKVEDHQMGPTSVYRLFAAGGAAPIGGMMTRPDMVPRAGWTFYFNVEGIDAGAERIKAHGGQVVHGPMEVPGGQWIVQGVDPQGASFALLSPTR
jgi:predicted enzyme related to lactoylglutathione lyase